MTALHAQQGYLLNEYTNLSSSLALFTWSSWVISSLLLQPDSEFPFLHFACMDASLIISTAEEG
jgi:hypothetical protein